MSQPTSKPQTAAVLQSVWAKATINTSIQSKKCHTHLLPSTSFTVPHLCCCRYANLIQHLSNQFIGLLLLTFTLKSQHHIQLKLLPTCWAPPYQGSDASSSCLPTALHAYCSEIKYVRCCIKAVAKWWVLSYSSLLTVSCGQSVLLLTSPQ